MDGGPGPQDGHWLGPPFPLLFLPGQLWLHFPPEALVGHLIIHPPPGTELT